MLNPFIISEYEGKEYFCDRIAEFKKLKEAFLNRRNVTLTSLRRMGKSALIQYLADDLINKADVIYVNIFSARNFPDLTIMAANAVTEFYGYRVKDFVKKFGALIRSIGGVLKFNDITGKPEIKIGLGEIKDERSFNEIIGFLESEKKHVLFVFDEFQQIKEFPEKNTEAILRTIIQKCKNINFIFLGSNKGMMDAMFMHTASPFYQSTQYMFLEEIDKIEYKKFIQDKFKKGRITIKDEQIEHILKLTKIHTYYVQYLCNRIYSAYEGKAVPDEGITDKLVSILKENEPFYYSYKKMLTGQQWDLLIAIAKEDNVKEPFSSGFMSSHKLGSASTVKRSLEALLKKEIITYYKDEYRIYDVFLSLWLRLNPVG